MSQPGAETTETAPAEAAAAPKSPALTQVMIGGKAYELKGMSEKEGQALYNALPPAEQKRADRIATTVQMIQSVASVDLPPDVDPMSALGEYFKFLKENRNNLSEALAGAPLWIQQLAQNPEINQNPRYKEIFSDLEKIGFVGSALDGATYSIEYVFGMPFRAIRALYVGGKEAKGALSSKLPGYSEEQAQAFAAAYVALEMDELARGAKETWFTQPVAAVGSAFSWVYNSNILGLSQIIPAALNTVGMFISNWIKTGDMPDIGALWNLNMQKAAADIAEKRAIEGTNFGEIFESKLRQQRNPRAALDRFEQLGDVAGIPTKDRGAVIANGGVVVAREDGTLQTVAKGGEVAKPVPGTESSTRERRAKDAAFDIIYPDKLEQKVERNGFGTVVGVGAGTVGMGVLGYAKRETLGAAVTGVWNAGKSALAEIPHAPTHIKNAAKGLASGVLEARAETLGGRGALGSKEIKLLGKIAKLEDEQAKLLAKSEQLATRTPRGGWGVLDWLHERRVSNIEDALEKADDKIQKAQSKAVKIDAEAKANSKLAKAAQFTEAAEELGQTGRVGKFTGLVGRVGGRLFVPLLAAGGVAQGAELANAVTQNDGRRMATSGADVATTAVTVGLLFFGPPGWIAATAVGVGSFGLDLVGWGPKGIAGKLYDKADPGYAQRMAERALAEQKEAEAQAALQQAAVEAEQKAAAARAAAQSPAAQAASLQFDRAGKAPDSGRRDGIPRLTPEVYRA